MSGLLPRGVKQGPHAGKGRERHFLPDDDRQLLLMLLSLRREAMSSGLWHSLILADLGLQRTHAEGLNMGLAKMDKILAKQKHVVHARSTA